MRICPLISEYLFACVQHYNIIIDDEHRLQTDRINQNAPPDMCMYVLCMVLCCRFLSLSLSLCLSLYFFLAFCLVYSSVGG